jgi:Zn finger protein HypA/HybF involved in hydrogenase expression
MHELSYMIRLARMASEAAAANHAKSVESVSVSIGTMVGLVPEYMQRYWPTAVKGTILEGSKLVIGEIRSRLAAAPAVQYTGLTVNIIINVPSAEVLPGSCCTEGSF